MKIDTIVILLVSKTTWKPDGSTFVKLRNKATDFGSHAQYSAPSTSSHARLLSRTSAGKSCITLPWRESRAFSI
jgi:hypothetical protein